MKLDSEKQYTLIDSSSEKNILNKCTCSKFNQALGFDLCLNRDELVDNSSENSEEEHRFLSTLFFEMDGQYSVMKFN